MQSGDLPDSLCQPGHCIWRSLVLTLDAGREKVNTYGSGHLNAHVYTGDKAEEDICRVSYLKFSYVSLCLARPTWCSWQPHKETLGPEKLMQFTAKQKHLWKGTNVRTEPPPAWMRFQDRYLDGKAAFWEDASCHCWGWGAVVEVMDAEKLSGWQERGGNLGFLGLCQSSPADRMATAEGPCCEGGFSFLPLPKGKRGAPSQPLLPLIASSFNLSWLPGKVYLTVSFEKHLHSALTIITISLLHALSSLYFHLCDDFIYIVMHFPGP